MPSGIYERKGKITKQQIKDFVKFCFREDIATKLEKVKKHHLLAIQLYEQETGIKVKPQTAKKQEGKWILINGDIYEQ